MNIGDSACISGRAHACPKDGDGKFKVEGVPPRESQRTWVAPQCLPQKQSNRPWTRFPCSAASRSGTGTPLHLSTVWDRSYRKSLSTAMSEECSQGRRS